MAEALFRNDEAGYAATTAISSITHTARNQIHYFSLRGFGLQENPPEWIIRTENFNEDMAELFMRIGAPEGRALLGERDRAHKGLYHDAPPLSDLAQENLRRWYAQDIAFYAMCEDWLRSQTRLAGDP